MKKDPSPQPIDETLVELYAILGVGALATREAEADARQALADDEAGTLALARRLAASTSVRSPTGAFVAAIRRGQHREVRAASGGVIPDGRISPAEAMLRLYNSKLDTLERLGWRTYKERQIEAMDYACSWVQVCNTSPMPEGGIPQLETELCHELGIDRHWRPAIAHRAGPRP